MQTQHLRKATPCETVRGSPSMETDVAFKLTSGDEGRATSSRRQAVTKVALAGNAGKLPQGVVMDML